MRQTKQLDDLMMGAAALALDDPAARTIVMPLDQPGDDGRDTGLRTLASPKYALPAAIRYRAKTEEELMASVPFRIPQMLRQYFGVDPMPWQVNDLIWMFLGGHLVKLRPTGHGKSTGGCVHFPILSLCENPNAAHGIVTVNLREAKRWMGVITRNIEHNKELTRDYPWLKKPDYSSGRVWTKTEIIISGRTNTNNPNPSVVALGAGDDSIKGRRFMGTFDDLEGSESELESARADLLDWVQKEAVRTHEDPVADGNPRPLTCYQGTPYDVDSLYFKLAEDNDFSTSILPYRYPMDWHEEHRRGKLICPYLRDGKLAEFRKRMSPEEWKIQLELDPKGGDQSILGYDEIVKLGHRSERILEESLPTFVCLDPSSGSTHRRADYAGISVNRLQWPAEQHRPNVETLRAFKFKLGVIEQIHLCAELAYEFNCPVIVEGNSQQGRTYKTLFAQYHPDIVVNIFITTKQKKMDPIMGLTILQTLMREGYWKQTTGLGSQYDAGMRTLWNEVRDLGSGAHDHIAMSVWFSVRWVYEHARGRTQRAAVVVNHFNRPRASFGRTVLVPSRATRLG